MGRIGRGPETRSRKTNREKGTPTRIRGIGKKREGRSEGGKRGRRERVGTGRPPMEVCKAGIIRGEGGVPIGICKPMVEEAELDTSKVKGGVGEGRRDTSKQSKEGRNISYRDRRRREEEGSKSLDTSKVKGG